MDGYTLLIVVMVFCGFMAIAWLINATVFKLASQASYYWCVSNFLLCPYVLLYNWRGTGPDFLTFQMTDFCILTSPLLLRRGAQVFVHDRINNLEDFSLYAAAFGTMLYARYLGDLGQSLAVCTISMYFAFNMGRIAHRAYAYMRAEFEFRASLITVLPCIVTAMLFVVRTVNVILSKDNAVLLQTKGVVGFNTFFLLGTLVCAIAFNSSLAGLAISRLIAKIHQLSIEDSLTKIANRRRIESLLETQLVTSRKERRSFAIIMLDVDHFKKVNDVYGHAAGDAALVVCASVIKKAVRGSDHIGRFGGEEFCAVLPNTDEAGAQLTAERMRTFLESEILIWDGQRIPLTASLGVAIYYCGEETSSDLLKLADGAMYRAKNRGRNQVVVAARSEVVQAGAA